MHGAVSCVRVCAEGGSGPGVHASMLTGGFGMHACSPSRATGEGGTVWLGMSGEREQSGHACWVHARMSMVTHAQASSERAPWGAGDMSMSPSDHQPNQHLANHAADAVGGAHQLDDDGEAGRTRGPLHARRLVHIPEWPLHGYFSL